MSTQASPVRASCGFALGRTSPFTDPARFDYIVIVGGLLQPTPQIDRDTGDYLKSAAKAGVPLIGLCTGSFILARLGLLDGKRCCVSWYHYQDFLAEFPGLEPEADQLFLVDGGRITCAGGGGTADLASFLIERHIGRSVATEEPARAAARPCSRRHRRPAASAGRQRHDR